MKTQRVVYKMIAVGVVGILLIPQSLVFANTTASVRFNNENWFTRSHPRVASFSVNTDGSASGLTENGIAFVQFNVQNTYGMRIQRFEIQDHYHYIVDGEVINSFTEFSMLLADAYSSSLIKETV